MSALQSLIPVVNRLQDIVTNANLADLDLPMLTVIGSQSAGKSSVLENIVGKDFLPRGTGIVTRRPLVLQLINIHPEDPLIQKMGLETDQDGVYYEDQKRTVVADEWAEFLHIPDKRFYDFENVKHEIEHETARVAGQNKGISRVPINLKIYSPNVLNLTLVDLPGLTKIPIGDQPTDIERQIKNLLLEYISNPNSIILAVSPANVDIVNSEALKLAREVDPHGERTIGIMSKLDLMDHGTNALDILAGNVYPLKLGFIGVVNRSQQDITTCKTLEDSLASESDFFLNHPAYRSIASRCGTDYLAKKLHQTLMSHIRDRLPDIKTKLNTLIGQTQEELASYGTDDHITDENRGALILQLMNHFSTSFVNSIEGNSSDISTKELCGGARIYYIYNEVFSRALKSIDPMENLTIQDIRTAIRNSTGPRPSLFVPELAFDLLVKPQIKLLEGPSHRCIELVYEELMKICHTCGTKDVSRYPRLHGCLIEVVSDLLAEQLKPTSTYIQSMIDINRAYINTNHPDFVGAANAMSSVVQDLQRDRQKPRRKDNVEFMSVPTTPNGSFSTPKRPQTVEPSPRKGVPTPQKESPPVKVTAGENDIQERDSFLNYFFGKESRPSSPTKLQKQIVMEDEESTKFTDSFSPEVALQFKKAAQDGSFNTSFEQLDIKGEKLGERERMECELIRRLIISYFGIVRQTIQDQVPKAIMCMLVNRTRDSVQNRLVQKLYKERLFDDLLYEDETLTQEREKCRRLLQTYQAAADVISEVI